MIQCKDGHFYDPAKHSACPWCVQPFDVGGEGKTTPLRPALDDAGKTTPLRSPVAAPSPAAAPSEDTNIGVEAKTRPLYAVPPPASAPAAMPAAAPAASPTPAPLEPVVGWLVAMAGPERGRDFRLRAERNFIGPTDVIEVGDTTLKLVPFVTAEFNWS